MAGPGENQENLIPLNRRSKEEQRLIQSAAGKASGAARRRKADLRKMAQDILTGTYEVDGEKKTGTELFAAGIVQLMQDPYAKNWGKAAEVLMRLTGSDLTPDEIKKQKAEIALLKAKQLQIKSMTISGEETQEDDGFIDALGASAASDWTEHGEKHAEEKTDSGV